MKYSGLRKLLCEQWPNLMNLSGGLNLSRGLNMVGSTYNCIKCFKILAGAKFKPGLADLNRGSNSLNSISGFNMYAEYTQQQLTFLSLITGTIYTLTKSQTGTVQQMIPDLLQHT